jgi:predicted ribosome quality control (RQC) complex YloA/Tae2 family protein
MGPASELSRAFLLRNPPKAVWLTQVHQDTLKEIVSELEQLLSGRFVGKIIQLSPQSMVIDFGLRGEGYLFVSTEPAAPRLHLIQRSVRDLQKGSLPLSTFAQAARTILGGGSLISVTRDLEERIVRLAFSVTDDLGDRKSRALVIQLTGRSANLFLLDAAGVITHAFRDSKGEGQQIGAVYSAPAQSKPSATEQAITRGEFSTLSAAMDEHYTRLEARHAFERLSKNLMAALRKDISKRKKLKANLNGDLAAHGNPEEHKRRGDLLLANIANAERHKDTVKLKDYYAEGAPTIEVQIDENASLQEAAAESFSRYTKSKRAVDEIGTRMVQIDRELRKLEDKQSRLQKAIASGEESALAEFADPKASAPASPKKKKAPATLPGMRHYRSSDGYEVIVGRTARDNDNLTFRVARPNDLWLHAGDYPGSHVIVRNSTRKEIPHRTVVEAAQLAAKFSQASKDSKVSVHYALRKFIAKPKGAASGLVRMSSFRTITVEPGENIERLVG